MGFHKTTMASVSLFEAVRAAGGGGKCSWNVSIVVGRDPKNPGLDKTLQAMGKIQKEKFAAITAGNVKLTAWDKEVKQDNRELQLAVNHARGGVFVYIGHGANEKNGVALPSLAIDGKTLVPAAGLLQQLNGTGAVAILNACNGSTPVKSVTREPTDAVESTFNNLSVLFAEPGSYTSVDDSFAPHQSIMLKMFNKQVSKDCNAHASAKSAHRALLKWHAVALDAAPAVSTKVDKRSKKQVLLNRTVLMERRSEKVHGIMLEYDDTGISYGGK